MKRFITLFVICSLTVGSVVAQNEPVLKVQVIKSIYHDVSPPLSEMAKTAPQKADNSWKDGVVKNNHYPFGFPKNEMTEAQDNTVQAFQGLRKPDSLMLSYEGISNLDNVYPPDTDGDVSPDNYFQVVNLHYSIYDKAGNKLLGPLLNSTMFGTLPNNHNDGDAVVLYDEVEGRWIFTQFSLPHFPNGPFFEMVAVSATSDPLGSWYRYEFQFSDMPDYPKLGVWPDGIYMTCNRFSSGSTNALGTGAACFDKAAMYANAPSTTMQYFTLPYSSGAWAILPSDCDGTYPPTGTPNFFAWLTAGHLHIYGFHVDWTTPSNSTFGQLTNLTVSSFSTVTGIPQKGSTVQLDAISGRIMFRLPFRKFNDHWSMVCNSTINVSGHAGIRWWELQNDGTDPANWNVFQESTFSPDANSRWMGSIAIDSLSNIALGYSISSSTLYPSVYYTGRVASDPLNTMTVTETSIMDGGGAQTYVYGGKCRWGDYSAMSADPASPGKFWYTQEYMQTTSSMAWHTRIGTFTIGNILIASASAVPSIVCTGDSTQLDVTATGGSGTYTYSWTSNPAGFTSTAKNPWAHPSVSTVYTVAVNDGTNTITSSTSVTVQPGAVSNAGNDTTYCNYVPVFSVHGSGSGYDQSLWSTLGDGHFDDPTSLVTQYHPWTQDKANGVKLVLSVHSLLPCHGIVNDTVKIMFDPCTGVIDPLARDLSINVQPNPSNGNFTLFIDNLGNQTANVVITDLQGHAVYNQVCQMAGNSLQKHIDLSFLPKGSYIMKVTTDTRNKIEKLIIQ